MSGYIFYVLGSLMLIFALCAVILPKISLAIISCGLFFMTVSCLYFFMNFPFLGLFQFVIFGIFITALLITAAKLSGEDKLSFPFVKKPRVFLCIISVIILASLIWALLYYFKTSVNEIIFLNKGFIASRLLSLYIAVKTIFVNYLLAYLLVILTLFAGLTGVGILIPRKKADNNDK